MTQTDDDDPDARATIALIVEMIALRAVEAEVRSQVLVHRYGDQHPLTMVLADLDRARALTGGMAIPAPGMPLRRIPLEELVQELIRRGKALPRPSLGPQEAQT